MNKPEYIVLHHSATPDNVVLEDTIAIRRYHVQEKGWDDVGYHFLVERVLGIWSLIPGRPVTRRGAHCIEAGMNHRSIGVCLVGDFDREPPALETLKFLVQALQAMMVNYNIPTQRVIGHRDAGIMDGFDWRKVGSTGVRQFKTCPGIVFPMQTLADMLNGTIRV